MKIELTIHKLLHWGTINFRVDAKAIIDGFIVQNYDDEFGTSSQIFLTLTRSHLPII